MNVIEFNKKNITNYLNSKNIVINNLDYIFNKIKLEIGKKKNNLYACVDGDDPFKIILSEEIKNEDIYKWVNHEMIHIISNNQPTVNNINVGGIIVEYNDTWIGKYLNEAITEYINQQIIKDKYSDYYDVYINELYKIINIIGEKIILDAYFNNDLYLIINELSVKTNYSKENILKYIIDFDFLYDENYKSKIIL